MRWLLFGWAVALAAPAWARIDPVPEDRLGAPLRDPVRAFTDWSEVAEADCPIIPSFALCTDPAWIASACAALDRRRAQPLCPRLVEADQAQAFADAPRLPLLSADTARDVDGRLRRFGPGQVDREGAGLASGLVGPHARPVQGGTSTAQVEARRHDGWTRNCSVQSCEEYVREAFYDYVVFEERAAAAGDDWRAVFELIYEADGLASRTLQRFRGARIADLTPARRQYRNRFVAFQPWQANLAALWVDVVRAGVLPDVPADFFDVHGGECRFDPVRNAVQCQANVAGEVAAQAQALNRLLEPFDPELAAGIQPAAPDFFPPNGADPWGWHRQMSDALAAVPDERLLWLDDAQRSFMELRAERAATVEALRFWVGNILANLQNPGGDDFSDLIAEQRPAALAVARRLRALDRKIQQALAEAAEWGCLGGDALTPCDWSPRWLAEDLRGRFVQARAEAETLCQQRTANNFSWLHAPEGDRNWLQAEHDRAPFCVVGGEPVPGCTLRRSYVGDTPAVEQYFSTVQAWLESLEFPQDPETGRVIIGGTTSDRLDVGSGLFGVDFLFSGGWRLETVTGGPARADDPCANLFRSEAAVSVDAHAFGIQASDLFQFADPEADFSRGLYHASVISPVPGRPRDTAAIDLQVLGNALYTGHVERGTHQGTRHSFYFAAAPDYERRRDEEKTFTVGVVPVTVRAGIAGQAALAVNVQREGDRCAADAEPFDGHDESHTRIEPSVSATAYAQASLGIPGASIGVRGDVTLIRLGFPLTVDGGYGGPRAVAPDALSARILAAQTLRLLTGHISLVLEFPFDTYTKRIFGWQGPSWTNEVIRDELAGPLLVLLEAFGVGDARARQPVEFDPGLVCEVPHPVPELGLTYFDFDDEHVDLPARRLTSVPFAAERDDPAAALTWGAAGVQTGLPGVQGQAFALDAGAAVDLSLSDLPVVNFSYSLWVNPAAAGPATLLALGDADGTPRIQLDLDADNRLVSVGGCGAAFSRRLVSAEVPVAPGEWHQVGVTYDLRAQQVGLYLDGRLMDTREGCDLLTLGDSRAIARPLPGGQGVPFVGRIDDFARWDGVALTPAQMAEVVERGLDGRPVAGPGAAVPAGVTALTAEGFDDRVVLRWTNPPSLGQPGGFDRVQIRADATVAPQTPAQGVLVYEGVASTATHQELTPGQTWHYRAFAAGAGDRVVPGPQALAVTVNAPPAAVAGFTATPGVGHAALRWQRPAAPDVAFVMVRRSGLRHPGPAEGQLVYRGQGEAFTDEVLDGGRQYYTAFAQDYAGNLSPAARAQADILAVGDLVIQPPPAVESLVATPGDRQVRLDWTLTAGRAAERIEVIRREVDGFGTARFALGPVPSYTDAALINGRRYEYLVRAFDRLGRPGAPQVVVAAPEGDPRPAPPRGFDARVGGGAVTLQWEPAANPEEIVVIRRSTQTAPQTLAQGTEVARGGAGLFVDAAVEAGRRYHYSAFTLSAGGLVSLPTSRSVRLPDDAAPPPAVTALRAVPGPERVQLLWTLPDAADLAGVRVTVAPVAPVVGPEVLLFDGLADAVVHSPADAEVTYRYRVLAYDHSGNESPAVTVEATPGAPAGPQAEAGADQATLGGAWIWLDGSASAAPPGTFYTWTQIGGPAVRIVNANRPLARFLAPDGPGELTFELTVRQGAVADRDRTVVRLDGPPAALPPEPAEERLAISEFELSLHASAELVVAHEPQAQQIHLIDPETRQVLGQFPVSAGRFVGVDAGRAAFLSDGRTLITIDVSDPAAPAELAPLPIDVSFDGTVVLASGRALAFNRRTGELRLADATPEGWAVRFDTTVPDGRVARDVVVHGDFAYVAIAATQALPEGVQALDLTGQEAVWGSVEAVPGHSITRLLVADDDLLILGLPADPVAFRLLRVGLADPTTPGPVVPLAGDFAQPDLFQSLAAVAGQLFAISIARPGLVDAVALEADRAAVGPGFPGPDAPAGAFALWPPEAPQEVWVPAEGSGAAPGVVSIHALDVPRGLPWPAVAAASAPTVVAADGSRVVAAGRAGAGTYRLTDAGVEAQGFAPYAQPLEEDPILLVLNGAGGAIAERTGPVSARLRRIGLGANGALFLGDAVDLPSEPKAAWRLDTLHVLLDLGFVGYQVYDLSGAAPAPVGEPFGANGQLGAYDPEARRLLVWLSEQANYALFDLSDPTTPVELPGGALLQAPPGLPSPFMFLTSPSTAAALVGDVFSVFQDDQRYDFVVGEQPAEAPRTTVPARAPGRLLHQASLQSWALLAGGRLRWWDAPDGVPSGRAVGAVTLPAAAAPANGGAFPPSGSGPYGWAISGDVAWIAAGPSGLMAVPMAPVRLEGPIGPVQAGDSARWRVRWAPAAGVAPSCRVSAGACELEAVDAAAGDATVRWDFADAGPATLRVQVGHSTTWRLGEVRVNVEAGQ